MSLEELPPEAKLVIEKLGYVPDNIVLNGSQVKWTRKEPMSPKHRKRLARQLKRGKKQ